MFLVFQHYGVSTACVCLAGWCHAASRGAPSNEADVIPKSDSHKWTEAPQCRGDSSEIMTDASGLGPIHWATITPASRARLAGLFLTAG